VRYQIPDAIVANVVGWLQAREALRRFRIEGVYDEADAWKRLPGPAVGVFWDKLIADPEEMTIGGGAGEMAALAVSILIFGQSVKAGNEAGDSVGEALGDILAKGGSGIRSADVGITVYSDPLFTGTCRLALISNEKRAHPARMEGGGGPAGFLISFRTTPFET